MKIFLEVDWNIWHNFHIEYPDWITTDFELKFKNSSRLEFDLNSKEFENLL
jgi:hypothetical protein